MYFLRDFDTIKKMRDVRTIILAGVSLRDLCYVSENEGFRFAKNKLIHADSSFIARRSRAHFCFMKFIPINVLVPYLVGIIDRRLGGRESNREIVSSRACVRSEWMPIAIVVEFTGPGLSLFPFAHSRFSLFPWHPTKLLSSLSWPYRYFVGFSNMWPLGTSR